MKINFHRVLLGFFENWDKSSQKKWDKGAPDVVWRDWGEIWYNRGMKNDCIFCAIAEGEIPSFKIYEDEMCIAYLDINPFSEGHTLVIPKAHSEGLLDTPCETLAELVKRVKKVARHIKTTLNADGFNILQNNGEAAGQTVRHIHFHIVPRFGLNEIRFESSKGDMDKLKALAERLSMA